MAREITDETIAGLVSQWKEAWRPGMMERRYVENVASGNFEDPQKPVIEGYAAVFNQRTNIGHFWEQVSPGAFTKTIGTDDIYALWNHDPSAVLGNTRSGTLELTEDAHGLKYRIIPPDTTVGRDVKTLIRRGDIRKSSFGFNIIGDDVSFEGKERIRTLTEVKLFDVSPVTFPAYQQTEVHVRMLTGTKERAYLFEDSGNVVVEPIGTAISLPDAVPVQSNEDFFKQIEDFRNKIFG